MDFHTDGTELLIESVLELDVYSTPELDGLIEPAATHYPFVYSSDDRFDASQMVTRHYPDEGEVKAWVGEFVPGQSVWTRSSCSTRSMPPIKRPSPTMLASRKAPSLREDAYAALRHMPGFRPALY